MRIALAADHGGFELKEQLAKALRTSGYDVVDYPDFVVPLAKAHCPERGGARSRDLWERRGGLHRCQQGSGDSGWNYSRRLFSPSRGRK